MNTPLVSVVLPVYNGEKYLNEAIDSILNQTFTDFEFIILNDGSTDETEEIILSYADPRIRYVKNETNLQIVKTLNKGISLAKGKYIARTDADDFSLPHRLAIQLKYMQSHPEVIVCGSYIQIYEQPKRIWKVPVQDEAIKAMLLFESCLLHPTVIFTKDMALNNKYRSSFLGAEDYDLWERLSEDSNTHFANIPEVLLLYRLHPNDDRRNYKARQRHLANLIRHRQLKKLGIITHEQNFLFHETFSYNDDITFQLADLKYFQQWLNQIEYANDQHAVYSPPQLKKELEYRWLKICRKVAFQHPFVIFTFLLSRWSPNTLGSIYYAIRMLWRLHK